MKLTVPLLVTDNRLTAGRCATAKGQGRPTASSAASYESDFEIPEFVPGHRMQSAHDNMDKGVRQRLEPVRERCDAIAVVDTRLEAFKSHGEASMSSIDTGRWVHEVSLPGVSSWGFLVQLLVHVHTHTHLPGESSRNNRVPSAKGTNRDACRLLLVVYH